MKSLKQVQVLAEYVVDIQAELGNTAMMTGVHKIVEMDWKMGNKPWWVNEQVSSDGYDSLKDAVDLMGRNNPKLAVTPYAEGEENKQQAEAIEQVLMWQLDKLASRRGAPIKQATKQAYKYARVCGQLIYLPWQIETLKTMGKDTKREKLALDNGDFMLKVHDARNVYPYYTDYGLEGVLVKSVLPQNEVYDFWGKEKTAKLKAKMDADEKLHWVTQFEYWDLDQHCIWVVPHAMQTDVLKPTEEGYLIMNEKNDLPFLPWVVTELEEELRPMLYPVWKSGQWELMNIYLSAASSEVMAYIAAPRDRITGPNPKSVKVEYGEPNRPVEVPPGHEYDRLPPPGLDNALEQKIIQLQGMVSKSTIAHNVQTGDFGSDQAFASVREIIELSSRRLNDGKALLEMFWRDVFIKMLRWVDFTEASITAYVENEYTGANQITLLSPAKFEERGDGITFDVNNTQFKVELQPDIPEDLVARQNAASIYRQLGGSLETAMGMVGIPDARKEIQRARKEQMDDAHQQGKLLLIGSDYQTRAQMMMQQAVQQQQEQQQQQQQQQQQRSRGVGNQNLQGGQGFNPAMGGTPPDIANPGTSSPPIQGAINGL